MESLKILKVQKVKMSLSLQARAIRVRRRLLAHELGIILVQLKQLLRREIAEGAARGGENDAAKTTVGKALDALQEKEMAIAIRVRLSDISSVN